MLHKKEVYEYNKTSQHFRNIFLFPAVVGPSLIFYYLIFTSTTFSQQILGKKLLLVLKLCNKKNKRKDNTKKIMRETYNEFWLTQFDYIY